MHDLVYVKYNQKLKQRHNYRDEIDPITLNNIDDCNEWLVGDMMDDDMVHDGDDTLSWKTVYEASGLGEPMTYTRRRTSMQKKKSDSSAAKASKKGGTSSTSSSQSARAATARGKRHVGQEDDENEWQEILAEVAEEQAEEDGFEDEDSDSEG